jgi:hypothetical protein
VKAPSSKAPASPLETKAINILGAVGLVHRKTRKRRSKDVDMVFGRDDFPFGAWNVRFKVCDELSLDDVATEVGIAQGNGNRVALVASTGRVNSAAKNYAAYVSDKTRFQVIVLDGRDLVSMERNPRCVRRTLAAQTNFALFLPTTTNRLGKSR